MSLFPSPTTDESSSASSLVVDVDEKGVGALKTVARRWLLKAAVEELESLVQSVWDAYERRNAITVTIDDWALREALLLYISTLEEATYDQKYQAILAEGSLDHHHPHHAEAQAGHADESSPRVHLTPMPGESEFRFRHEGTEFAIRRNLPGDRDWGNPVYELVTHGGAAEALRGFLQGAVDFYENQSSDTIDIYHSTDQGWQQIYRKRPRPLSSVILQDGLKQTIRADMESFLADEDWYVNLGIPWRRGYLFHGPPGTGKSSLTEALAGTLDMDLYSVSLSNGEVSDADLQRLFQQTSPRSVILLEEIDRVYDGNGDDTVSIGGLLNCLDGVTAPAEGRIVVMTTNHFDRLGNALLRDGRSDVVVELGLATPEQARRLFLKFFPEKEAHADAFKAEIPPETLAPSDLQGHLRTYRDDPDAAISQLTL